MQLPVCEDEHFPSFSEGLSLRQHFNAPKKVEKWLDFPSFSEGLSLRHR